MQNEVSIDDASSAGRRDSETGILLTWANPYKPSVTR
jgi:hypothetical protein